MDLFDPGSGSQLHDFNPGIWPNGLFWTMQIPDWSFNVHPTKRHATLWLPKAGVPDNFEAFTPNCVASELNILVQWDATGAPEGRGLGAEGDEAAFSRFSGNIAEARCTSLVEGAQTGFSFKTNLLSSDGFYANIGAETNGSYV